jgi:hypothetical protein
MITTKFRRYGPHRAKGTRVHVHTSFVGVFNVFQNVYKIIYFGTKRASANKMRPSLRKGIILALIVLLL